MQLYSLHLLSASLKGTVSNGFESGDLNDERGAGGQQGRREVEEREQTLC
jgi:hypothetical protein